MEEIKNNNVKIVGEIVSEFVYSHKLFGERFYTVDISAERKSGTKDIIPVLISERLLGKENKYSLQDRVCVCGQYRSHNDGKHLLLHVFAREFSHIDAEKDENDVFLDGYICKTPVFRKTPLGKEIAEIIIAVNRRYKKSDYIPCICWGRNARFISEFEDGARVQIHGRIQSREYKKRISEEEFETRTTHEVSISTMEVIEDEQK